MVKTNSKGMCIIDKTCYSVPLGRSPIYYLCHNPEGADSRPCGFAEKGDFNFDGTKLKVFYCKQNELEEEVLIE